MRVVVTGGAGFLGSHLCAALIERGDAVVCIDDFSTGRLANITNLLGLTEFTFVRTDVCQGLPIEGPVDVVAHLASLASPPDYHRRPLETLAVGSRGTEHALDLAARHGARFVLTSTSEIYGEPLVHPQPEDYWGNVNTVGPRSVYDEAKRYAEAVTMAHRRVLGTDIGVVRIFNTYGPQMRPHDGRVVTSFVAQALTGTLLTIYGDGTQTRSFCYVDDLIRGLVAMIDAPEVGPVNLGNPEECTVAELAVLVLELTGSSSHVEYPRCRWTTSPGVALLSTVRGNAWDGFRGSTSRRVSGGRSTGSGAGRRRCKPPPLLSPAVNSTARDPSLPSSRACPRRAQGHRVPCRRPRVES